MHASRFELQSERLVRCYVDRPANVGAMLRASFGRSAVVDGTTHLDYWLLGERAETLAAILTRLGVQKGDRVAVMVPNGLDAISAVVAIALLGAIVVPIGTRLKHPEI